MATAVTFDKVLKLAAQLTDSEQKELVEAVKAQQRKRLAWERQLAKDAKQALADSKAGKLKRFSNATDLLAELDAELARPNERNQAPARIHKKIPPSIRPIRWKRPKTPNLP